MGALVLSVVTHGQIESLSEGQLLPALMAMCISTLLIQPVNAVLFRARRRKLVRALEVEKQQAVQIHKMELAQLKRFEAEAHQGILETPSCLHNEYLWLDARLKQLCLRDAELQRLHSQLSKDTTTDWTAELKLVSQASCQIDDAIKHHSAALMEIDHLRWRNELLPFLIRSEVTTEDYETNRAKLIATCQDGWLLFGRWQSYHDFPVPWLGFEEEVIQLIMPSPNDPPVDPISLAEQVVEQRRAEQDVYDPVHQCVVRLLQDLADCRQIQRRLVAWHIESTVGSSVPSRPDAAAVMSLAALASDDLKRTHAERLLHLDQQYERVWARLELENFLADQLVERSGTVTGSSIGPAMDALREAGLGSQSSSSL